jgi:hypothetical protein
MVFQLRAASCLPAHLKVGYILTQLLNANTEASSIFDALSSPDTLPFGADISELYLEALANVFNSCDMSEGGSQEG